VFRFGDSKVEVSLPTSQSYSSYVMMPLLNLAVRRRCLLVGGPGRGKTVIATLLGILSGYNLTEVKQGIQHGQPQMTIADLLGSPLPSTMINAARMHDIQIAWRAGWACGSRSSTSTTASPRARSRRCSR
jgi:MoxR-like ATPase